MGDTYSVHVSDWRGLIRDPLKEEKKRRRIQRKSPVLFDYVAAAYKYVILPNSAALTFSVRPSALGNWQLPNQPPPVWNRTKKVHKSSTLTFSNLIYLDLFDFSITLNDRLTSCIVASWPPHSEILIFAVWPIDKCIHNHPRLTISHTS